MPAIAFAMKSPWPSNSQGTGHLLLFLMIFSSMSGYKSRSHLFSIFRRLLPPPPLHHLNTSWHRPGFRTCAARTIRPFEERTPTASRQSTITWSNFELPNNLLKHLVGHSGLFARPRVQSNSFSTRKASPTRRSSNESTILTSSLNPQLFISSQPPDIIISTMSTTVEKVTDAAAAAVNDVTNALANTSLTDKTADEKNAANDAVLASAAEGRRLYIGNLAYATTEGELKDFFKGYLV
ncbi:hypothetical protein B0T14DRAFT_132655 [Immersiella caudata]|uniref:RRM domain-containing protein n=1 Tax=Immersiella caudata TaxID=314043 RepID=A0AA39X4Q5_9PEZI|nr:hypothetical protein B0T14DRAFT_132655 [Immersiella caudata]